MHLRTLGLTLATLALVLVAACGGDDKGGSPLSGGSGSGNTWDVAKADDLTHAALIVARTCRAAAGLLPTMTSKTTTSRWLQAAATSRASRKTRAPLRSRGPSGSSRKTGTARDDFGTQIESTVTVFKDSKTASDFANRYKGIVNSDKFISCFESEIKSETGSNAKVVD